MRFVDFFSRQARKPRGLFGRFFMSKVFDKGNAELNALTLATLPLRDNSRVLEIGSGTGALIEQLAGRPAVGLVEGVDFSKPMTAIARKRNREAIKMGRVRIHLGDFDATPFEPDAFDAIASVNTVYFWSKPAETMARIYELLRPGGAAIIGFHEKSDMERMPLARDIFRYYSIEDMAALFADSANFRNIRTASEKGTGKTCYCALGFK